MNDLTWCCSPDCPVKCERHITNYPVKDTSELVSIADFSGMCREHISNIVDAGKTIRRVRAKQTPAKDGSE